MIGRRRRTAHENPVVGAAPPVPGSPPPPIEVVCAGDGPGGGPVAVRLVQEVLTRRTWAAHRHVHLVRAFEESMATAPIATALSIGCGAGLSELFLASRHPEVQFHLTDFDQTRLDIGRKRASDLRITNVTFGTLDLLESIGATRYDWVSSIEVLEHIVDDQVAARNLVELSGRWFWILVPQCPVADLTDPSVIKRVWDNNGHHRPGYTPETLTTAIGGRGDVEWMRSCYVHPGAFALRKRIRDLSNEEILVGRTELVAAACVDLDNVDAPQGAGIEVLGRRDR